MKLIESVCKEIEAYIEAKDIIEIACGEAGFSIESAKYANRVIGIDIEDLRLKRVSSLPDNVELIQHDALELDKLNARADVIVCMNGLGHMQANVTDVFESAVRKVGSGGKVIFISSWKMDRTFVQDVVLPLLDSKSELETEMIRKKQYDIQVITVK